VTDNGVGTRQPTGLVRRVSSGLLFLNLRPSFAPTIAGAFAAVVIIRQAHSWFSGSVLTAVAGLGLLAGGMAGLNSYADREIDAVAHPSRPLPAGRITLAQARVLMIGALVGAVVLLALSLSWLSLGVMVGGIAGYVVALAAKHKGRLNEAVKILVTPGVRSLGYVVLGLTFTGPAHRDFALFCLAHFLGNTGSVLLHEVFDAEGDAQGGVSTAGTSWSPGRIRRWVLYLNLAQAAVGVGLLLGQSSAARLAGVGAILGALSVRGTSRSEAFVMTRWLQWSSVQVLRALPLAVAFDAPAAGIAVVVVLLGAAFYESPYRPANVGS
jgi:4-hydroxybenzoate polyprenyltransferase